MAKTRTFTIRLIKEGLDESEIIKAGERLRSTKLKGIYDFSGNIYYKPSATKPPGWVTFLSAASLVSA